jgi:hypothetical protein
MRVTQHPTNNRVIGAPKGWDQKEVPCGAVPVTDYVHEGLPVVITYWRPTAEEVAALARGEFLQLSVVGTSMPPVAIEVGP